MKILTRRFFILVFLVSSPFAVWAQSPDYDADGDGLIEINSLEQLNAIRYDMDGDGTVDSENQTAYGAAFPSAVGDYSPISCGSGG